MAESVVASRQRAVALPMVRLEHLWALVPLVLIFTYGASQPIIHSDFFYNLMNGRLMVEQRALLTRDVLAYAPQVVPFYNQPWLTQLAYYVEYQIGGYPMVLFVHACALTAAFAAVQAVARTLSGSARWASVATLIAVAIGFTNAAVRPQEYSFFPFALVWLLLVRYAARGWQLWLIPAIVAIWVNVHGAFLLGLGLVGISLLGATLEAYRPGQGPRSVLEDARVRRLALVGACAALATLLNPYGPWIYDYWLKATMDPVARATGNEWEPTTIHRPAGLFFFLSLIPAAVVAALVALRRQRPPSWTDALLLACFGPFALISIRNVVWWGMILPPLLAKYAALALPRRATGEPRREVALLNLALAATLVGIAGLSLPWLRVSDPLLAPNLRGYLDPTHPVDAVDYLRQSGASGRVWVRMEWGGFTEWELWPRLRPMVDARMEIRPPQVWYDYFTIIEARPGWEEILDRDRVDYLVLELSAFPEMRAAVAASPIWHEVYRDHLAAVYARR